MGDCQFIEQTGPLKRINRPPLVTRMVYQNATPVLTVRKAEQGSSASFFVSARDYTRR